MAQKIQLINNFLQDRQNPTDTFEMFKMDLALKCWKDSVSIHVKVLGGFSNLKINQNV